MKTIELDEIRHLKLDPNTIADAETVCNLGLIAMVHPANIGMRPMRALLWAGLRHEIPGLTLEKTGVLMDMWTQKGHSFVELEKIIIEAIEETGWFKVDQMFGSPKEDQGPNGKA